MNRRDEYDSYEIEELSDEERASSSSEDELDVLLHGTPDQKRKLLREYLTGESESSSEDEFEKEMTAELDCTLKSMESSWACPVPVAGTSSSREQQVADGASQAQDGKTTEYYEDIYFDSDSDEDGAATGPTEKKEVKLQRRIPTNDELFYDPDEDDQHQAWMDAQRQGCKVQNKSPIKNRKQKRSRPLPSSDAVLNCPACMTTLCIDCQRHEKYRTQYRAMFVMNCTVNKDEVLKYKMPKERRKKNKVKKSGEENEAQHEERYHPVKCSECSTEVAVFDKDEVYHFFNILASHC